MKTEQELKDTITQAQEELKELYQSYFTTSRSIPTIHPPHLVEIASLCTDNISRSKRECEAVLLYYKGGKIYNYYDDEEIQLDHNTPEHILVYVLGLVTYLAQLEDTL